MEVGAGVEVEKVEMELKMEVALKDEEYLGGVFIVGKKEGINNK